MEEGTALSTAPASVGPSPEPSGGARVPAIEVKHLDKRFGDLSAVDDVSFTVQQGELFAFLGPNGAGKPTTINILCTLATGGRARVAGYDVVQSPNEVRQNIGLVFQEPTFDDQLTAEGNLRFHVVLYGVAKKLHK